MTKQIDGGHAYPTGAWDYDSQNNILPYQKPGMSLRDAMAIAVVGQIWTQFYIDGTAQKYDNWRKDVAAEAYRIADALLIARDN